MQNTNFKFKENFSNSFFLPGDDIFLTRQDLENFGVKKYNFPSVHRKINNSFFSPVPRRVRKTNFETLHLPKHNDFVEKAAIRTLKATAEEEIHNSNLDSNIYKKKKIVPCNKYSCNPFCERKDHQLQKTSKLLDYVWGNTVDKDHDFYEFQQSKNNYFLPAIEDKIKSEVKIIQDKIDSYLKPKFRNEIIHGSLPSKRADYIYDQLKQDTEGLTLYQTVKAPENRSINLYKENPYHYSYINLTENNPLSIFPHKSYENKIYPISSKFESGSAYPYRNRLYGNRFLFTFLPNVPQYTPLLLSDIQDEMEKQVKQIADTKRPKFTLKRTRRPKRREAINLGDVKEQTTSHIVEEPISEIISKPQKQDSDIVNVEEHEQKPEAVQDEEQKEQEVPKVVPAVDVPKLELISLAQSNKSKLKSSSAHKNQEYVRMEIYKRQQSLFKAALEQLKKQKIANLKDNINDYTYNFVFEDVESLRGGFEELVDEEYNEEQINVLKEKLKLSFIEKLDVPSIISKIVAEQLEDKNKKIIVFQTRVMMEYRLYPFPLQNLPFKRPRLQDRLISMGWCRQNQSAVRNILIAYELREHTLYLYKPRSKYFKHFRFRKTVLSYLLPNVSEDCLKDSDKYTYIGGILLLHGACKIIFMDPPIVSQKEFIVTIERLKRRKYNLIPGYGARSNKSILANKPSTFPPSVWRNESNPYFIIEGFNVANEEIPITICLQGLTKESTFHLFYQTYVLGCASRYIYECRKKKLYPSYEVFRSFASQANPREPSHELYAMAHPLVIPEIEIMFTISNYIPSLVATNFACTGIGKILQPFELLCRTNNTFNHQIQQFILANLNLSFNELPTNTSQVLTSIFEKGYCHSLLVDFIPINEKAFYTLSPGVGSFMDTLSLCGLVFKHPEKALIALIENIANWPEGCKLTKLVMLDTTLPNLNDIKLNISKLLKSLPNLSRIIFSYNVSSMECEPSDERFLLVPTRLKVNPLELCCLLQKLYPDHDDINLAFCTFNGNFTALFELLSSFEDFANIRRLRLELCRGDMSLDPDENLDVSEIFHNLQILMENIRYPIKKRVNNAAYHLKSLYMFGSSFPFHKPKQITAFIKMLNKYNIKLLDISCNNQLLVCSKEDYGLLLYLLITQSPLIVLYINHSNLTDHVMEELKKITIKTSPMHKRKIHCISLRGNNLSIEGLIELIKFLDNARILVNHFDMTGNPISLLDLKNVVTNRLSISAGPKTVTENDLLNNLEAYHNFLNEDVSKISSEKLHSTYNQLWDDYCKTNPIDDQVAKYFEKNKRKTERKLTQPTFSENMITENRKLLLERLINKQNVLDQFESKEQFKSYSQLFDDNIKENSFIFSYREFELDPVVDIIDKLVAKHKDIHYLDFSNMDMRDSELQQLADYVDEKVECCVKTIDLSFNRLRKLCLIHLEPLIKKLSVKQIILDGNYFSDTENVGDSLHNVIMCSSLKLLSLNCTGLGEQTINDLHKKIDTTILERSYLKRLQCQQNTLIESDLDKLLEYLSFYCPYLTYLDVANTIEFTELEQWKRKIAANSQYNTIYINTIPIMQQQFN